MSCHIPVLSRRVPGHCKEMSINMQQTCWGGAEVG